MEKVKDKSNNLSKYFKGIDLKGRVSVLETAKTLLEVQKENDALLTDTPAPRMEAEKEGLA
jgi:PHP family Zn ribbon phosphoesterase